MTIPVAIRHRPFATEPITGLQTPDGIFDTALARLGLNVHVDNTGGADVNAEIYLESTSDGSITFTPATHRATLRPAAPTLFSWNVDVSAAPPGEHLISVVVASDAERRRIIKKIFVTRTSVDTSTGDGALLVIECPQGRLVADIREVYGGPRADNTGLRPPPADVDLVENLGRRLRACEEPPIGSATFPLKQAEVSVFPNPAYAGRYGELPFEDPWWKTALAVLFFVLLIAAAIVAIGAGVATIVIAPGLGAGVSIAVVWACCVTPAAIAATALGVGAIIAGFVAAVGDERDPWRRGEDHTLPPAGELTVEERLSLELAYPETLAPGEPFSVDASWDYKRVTKDATGAEHSYPHSVDETRRNVHVLDHYEIDAADVVKAYARGIWTAKARFFTPDRQLVGGELFVQCYLIGPRGEDIRLRLQDSGSFPDEQAGDGTYTGRYVFRRAEQGMWTFVVLAQDVNTATPDLPPEDAAKIIGGQVLTNQLQVSFEGGSCPFVPDGHINVIS